MKPTLHFLKTYTNCIGLTLIFNLIALPLLPGQNFNHPVSGSAFEYLSEGIYHYYDNGGPNGNYSNNILGSTISFIPDEGTYITWQLLNYDIESNEAACGGSCCDVLEAFWLPNCSVLAFSNFYCGTGQTFGPSFLCAGQSISFYFYSNAINTQAGWHIIIEVKQSNATNILCNIESNCFDSNVGGYLECNTGPIAQEYFCSGPGACTGVIDFYPECSNGYFPGLESIYGFDLGEISDITVSAGCAMNVFVVGNDPCQSTECYEATFSNGSFIVQDLEPGFYYLVLELDCSNIGDICFDNLVFECAPAGGGLNCDDAEPIDCDEPILSSNQEADGATDVVSDYCESAGYQYTGGEKVFEFISPVDGNIVVWLNQLSDDLDLFILSSCDPAACLATSVNSGTESESIQFIAVEGQHYLIVVDGYQDAESSFAIGIFCNGDLDCELTEPIGCGEVIESSNNDFDGGAYGEDDYCNQGSYGWNGREKIYEFFSTYEGTVTIRLTGLSADLDLFVLAQCDANDCIALSTNSASENEEIAFDAQSGQFYYIVIDGFADATSFYTLTMEDCCIETIYQCYDIRPEFISMNNGFEYNLSFTTPGIPILEWEIEGVAIANSFTNNLLYTFPTQGTYTVCAIYYDGAFGCYIKCCKEIVIDNPFNCGLVSYRYIHNQAGFRFTLEREASSVEEIIWTVDQPVELGLGNSLQSDLLSIGGNCREYIVSVRFFDKTSSSYRMCCMRLFLCSPSSCSGTILTTVTSDFKTRFYTATVYEEMEWYVNDVLVSTGASYEDLYATNSNLQVCLNYKDPATNNYRVCCRDVVTSSDEELSITKADIYPNPFSDKLSITIEFEQPTSIQIQIMDELGNIVKSTEKSDVTSTQHFHLINTATLPAGFYIIVIKSRLGVYSRKIVHM